VSLYGGIAAVPFAAEADLKDDSTGA